MILKTITARAFCSWAAFAVHPPVSIHAERLWMCVSCHVAWLMGAAICPVALGRIAASHGLFEGGRWCNSDYGHAQIDVTAPACGERGVRVVQQRLREETIGIQQNMALGALH
jgi:hypothetical protein